MKKRIFSLFMVFTLCFVSVDQVYADAGTLIVAGGSIASVGAGVIAGPAVVAVFCAMMAFGMNVELTEASEDAGMTKTEFIKSKLQEYCTEANISANTMNNYILDQAEVFKDGTIGLSKQAGNVIEKFINWLFSSEQVTSESTGTISSVSLNGVTCPVIQPGNTYELGSGHEGNVITIYNSGSKPLAIVGLKYYSPNAGDYYYALQGLTMDVTTFENFSITTSDSDGTFTKNNYTGIYNNVYNVDLRGVIASEFSGSLIPLYDEYVGTSASDAKEHFCNGITSIDFGGAVSTDTITGDMDDYDTSKHVLNPTQDQTIVINPNITIPVPDDKDISIDVDKYIEVIQDLIDGLREEIIDAIDTATDTPITIEFDPTQDWDPTIESEDDDTLDPDPTPIVVPDRIPIDYDIDPLTFDLKGIFPFCIPWDIKDMLSKLSADPIAPYYNVNWNIPIVNENLSFTIDLSPFDNVASILRKMEVLTFCIGLGLITRQMILRG